MKETTASEAIQNLISVGATFNFNPGGESTIESSVFFKKDAQKERDMAIRAEAIQEIMNNRNVGREEAEQILNNPF